MPAPPLGQICSKHLECSTKGVGYMLYFKNNSGEVYGYGSDQQPLIDKAIELGWEHLPVFPLPLTDAEILEAAKVEKLSEITVDNNTEIHADVTAMGSTFQADERSQTLLNSVITVSSAGGPLPSVWRDTSNVNVPINSITDLLAIAEVIHTQTELSFIKMWQRKEALGLASTVEAVSVI